MDIANLKDGHCVYYNDNEIQLINNPTIIHNGQKAILSYVKHPSKVIIETISLDGTHYLDVVPRNSSNCTRLTEDDKRYANTYLRWLEGSS